MLNTLHRYQARKSEDDSEQGFTLIELLIVIVVLGILAAVTVFALSGVTKTSISSACNSDAKTVDVALAAYNAQTGGTPVATQALLTGPYLQSWPSSTHYTVSIVAGAVDIATTAPVVAATPYDSAAGAAACANVT